MKTACQAIHMTESSWTFSRDESYHHPGSNRPTTDAIRALEQWMAIGKCRYFTNVEEEGEALLHAKLIYDKNDETCGTDLDAKCRNNGIKRMIR